MCLTLNNKVHYILTGVSTRRTDKILLVKKRKKWILTSRQPHMVASGPVKGKFFVKRERFSRKI